MRQNKFFIPKSKIKAAYLFMKNIYAVLKQTLATFILSFFLDIDKDRKFS